MNPEGGMEKKPVVFDSSEFEKIIERLERFENSYVQTMRRPFASAKHILSPDFYLRRGVVEAYATYAVAIAGISYLAARCLEKML